MDIEEQKEWIKVTTENGSSVNAKHVIVATNFPIYDTGALFARMGQMRSYALAVKPDGKLPEGMYLSASKDERSIRPHRDGEAEWLIVGGGSHPSGKKGVNEKGQYEKLEKFAKEKFDTTTIEYRWSAQDSDPLDTLPYIGRMPQASEIYVTTGYGEWGMTTSFVSAKILSDLILGEENPWTELFSPLRLSLGASAKKLVPEAKRLIDGYGRLVTKGENIKDIPPDCGQVVTKGKKKLAVYKDKAGKCHAVSAVCTHMGCLVNWNNAEKTWDCPCHGSRFSCRGKVINGPAVKDLPEESIGE
jgi:nitrite reductase/ring-hydroxylating ferredoxin subunit